MKIGGEYSIQKIQIRHFEKMAEEIGVGKSIIKNRVEELAQNILQALSKLELKHPTWDSLKAIIQKRCGLYSSLF